MNPDCIRSARMTQNNKHRVINGIWNVISDIRMLPSRMSTFKLTAGACGVSLMTIALLIVMWNATFKHHSLNSDVSSGFTFRPKYLGIERILPCTESNPCSFKIVADLDKKSRVKTDGKTHYISYLLSGWVWMSDLKVSVEFFKQESVLVSSYNEDGRGMELSELALFNGKLYTFDDRTGIVYELIGTEVVARYILTEGDGTVSKGMKIEWATVKDDVLWIGSFGKEFTSENGKQLLHQRAFWVVSLDKNGLIEHHNWEDVYTKVRRILNAEYPGYVIHEAVNWSGHLKRWVFLPRRISSLPYDDKADEMRASNKMIICSETFTEMEVITIDRPIIPRRGFSSFKFLPGSQDQVIIALKTEENEELSTQRSFLTAMTIEGKTLMDDLEVPNQMKFEGLEFDDL